MYKICVYADSIQEHDQDCNLCKIKVPERYLKKWFSQKDFDGMSFIDWLHSYIADETQDLYSWLVSECNYFAEIC